MAFRLPAMPITVNIWRSVGVGGFYVSPDVTTVANLTPGKRITVVRSTVPTTVEEAFEMYLLLPKLTDIRCVWNGISPDMVEVPAGSLRFYDVAYVDDIAKGFANEHRFAIITYKSPGALVFGFAAPVPLP